MLENIGKNVGGSLYFHVESLPFLDSSLVTKTALAANISGTRVNKDFNVIKYTSETKLSLLFYADFFEEPFPELLKSYVVDIVQRTSTTRDYSETDNPFILHRKELLLYRKHYRYPEYAALTESAESANLFQHSTRIGRKNFWYNLIEQNGLILKGHQLVASEQSLLSDREKESIIYRHKTALTRYSLSSPFQTLLEHNFLNTKYTVFDYGSGKGSDIELLKDINVSVSGWDPHFSPDNVKSKADIVNLGYVINVIEDKKERDHALFSAYKLAKKIFVVSAMLESHMGNAAKHYRDGIITTRGTFQKYFTQENLKHYIETTLNVSAIAIKPGIFYVFIDEQTEQSFFEKRQHRKRYRTRLTGPVRPSLSRDEKDKLKYESFKTILEPLWLGWLELGRPPVSDEINGHTQIEDNLGSLRKAFNLIKGIKNTEILHRIENERTEDLAIYFAIEQFSKRKPYQSIPEKIQRDIKFFFGNYKNAVKAGNELLYSIAKENAIQNACIKASKANLGYLENDLYFQFHSINLQYLPAILRTYVAAGITAFGEAEEVDLIKVHIASGKLSLIKCDSFFNTPLPRMIERIKINLRTQDIDYFDYDDAFYEIPYIFFKSRYLTEDMPNYQEQCNFDNQLKTINIEQFGKYGPKSGIFHTLLSQYNLKVNDFKLVLINEYPDIDSPCCKSFKFRDLIECGETQKKFKIPNLPKQSESYEALATLGRTILDPVIDYFGSIELTYGFCSHQLSLKVPGRNAPKLDQHSSHEVNSRGNIICNRLGAAVDFYVSDEDMLEVAQWIVEYLPFDRLYFYGNDLPIHVSIGPDFSKNITLLKQGKGGKLFPQTQSQEKFLTNSQF